MTSTQLIEPPEHLHDSDDPLAELPPLLSVVPVAGPPVFVYAGFGVVLLLLLVPPVTLLATLAGVVLLAAAALVALAALAGAILAAPVLLVHRLRGRPLGHFSLPVPRFRNVKARHV